MALRALQLRGGLSVHRWLPSQHSEFGFSAYAQETWGCRPRAERPIARDGLHRLSDALMPRRGHPAHRIGARCDASRWRWSRARSAPQRSASRRLNPARPPIAGSTPHEDLPRESRVNAQPRYMQRDPVRTAMHLTRDWSRCVGANLLDDGVGRYLGIRYVRGPAYGGVERRGREKRKRRTSGRWSVTLSAQVRGVVSRPYSPGRRESRPSSFASVCRGVLSP